MPVGPGSRLDVYEVVAPLGSGGMGEVWLARDLTLQRRVAIKVLPQELTQDPSRVARFQQEARAASALNHPNVCTIHALGEGPEGQQFIAMEYVEGETLRHRLGHLTLREALDIAVQVASALSAAHAAGVVHRDLKPENVMRRPDGFVKVLDFGLAKLLDSSPSDVAAATRTMVHTEAGTVVGTVAYMSPEQVRGQEVDRRTDIWSLGVMVYEMVAGRCPFTGGSRSEVLAAILDWEPAPLARFDPNVPSELQRIVGKALRKDRDERYQGMKDLQLDLQALRDEVAGQAWKSHEDALLPEPVAASIATPVPGSTSVAVTSQSSAEYLVAQAGRHKVTMALATCALALITVGAWWAIRHRPTVAAPQPAGETPPARAVPLTVLPGHERWPTFSPDGDQVAFEWDGENGDNADIYVTMVGSAEVRRLTTDPGGDHAPRWSPDGRQIAYVRDDPESGGRIHVMSPLGGSDRKLSGVPVSPPLAWSPDSRYLAAQRVREPAGIFLIPVDGGEPRRIVGSTPPRADSAPAFSPDGSRLAYVSCATPMFGCDVYVLELDRALVRASSPRRLTPSAVPLILSPAWTRDGRSVVYTSLAPVITYLWRVDVDGTGPPERLEVAGLGAAMPATALSRDRLAFVRIVVDTDVYRFQVGRPSVPVLASSFLEGETRFSPDGRRLVFASMRSADTFRIWMAAADGSGAQQVTRGPGFLQGSPWWSPDGRRIAFDAMTDDFHTHIWIVDADGSEMRRLTNDPGDQNVPYWSRDGRWMYFSADHGTGRDIWRVPAAGGPSQPVTRGGSGKLACESPDGQSLLYQPAERDSPLLALPLAGGAARQLVGCVKPTAFAAGPDGVYYVACDPGPDPELHVMNPATGRDRLLGRLEKYENQFVALGLAVSPDGASVLYPRRIRDSFDLMVIENFR